MYIYALIYYFPLFFKKFFEFTRCLTFSVRQLRQFFVERRKILLGQPKAQRDLVGKVGVVDFAFVLIQT